MKKLRNTFLILVCAGIIYSCGEGKKIEGNPELYAEANEYHQKSLDMREEILELEKQVKAAGMDYAELKDQLKAWDKDIIEVPGYEHSHDHDGHEHDAAHSDHKERKYHVHNPSKPFSDAEHLDYQKVMFEEMVLIHEKFKRLLSPEVME